MRWLRRGDYAFAVGAGVLYGIVAQLVVRLHVAEALFAVMSFGYIFLLPLVLAIVTVAAINRDKPKDERHIGDAFVGPFWTNGLCLVVAFAVGWEGSICLIALSPICLVLGTIGGLLAHFFAPAASGSRWNAAIVPLMALPLASAGVETQLPVGDETRVVHSHIDIQATREVVWSHIERVAPIIEPQQSFFFTMGFPRPIEATLSHERVGGVRHASFERGLLFVETITRWQPPDELRFTIDVDPAHTPPTTLDAHVTVGGRYFDVLEGGYRIEQLAPGRVRLHLDSHHRISTHFNFYTSLWSDYLMDEIQENILQVIKSRCER